MLILVIMGKWSDESTCCVVHDIQLYSVLDIVVISGDDVCCSVVFGTLVGEFVFSGMCYVVRVADDICYLSSSVVISAPVPESGVCVHISCED